MKVEGIECLGFEAARARRKLNLLQYVADTRHDAGLENLASSGVARNLSDRSLGVDGPSKDEVALDSGVSGERFFVTGARFVAVRDDNGANVFRSTTWIMEVRADPRACVGSGPRGRVLHSRCIAGNCARALRARGRRGVRRTLGCVAGGDRRRGVRGNLAPSAAEKNEGQEEAGA
jgi:hypothetical protein